MQIVADEVALGALRSAPRLGSFDEAMSRKESDEKNIVVEFDDDDDDGDVRNLRKLADKDLAKEREEFRHIEYVFFVKVHVDRVHGLIKEYCVQKDDDVSVFRNDVSEETLRVYFDENGFVTLLESSNGKSVCQSRRQRA
jgi:hypothetical protein